MPIYQEEAEVGGRPLVFETGRLAQLAGGAVTGTYGETVVLATATASHSPRQGVDFFPLTVDYEEKMYAAGKIPGGFIKREGRPSTESILVSRLTDRPLRPLFPKGFRNDVQVVITPLSVDLENTPDVVAITAASTALMISDIPFGGPIGAVRVALVDGEFIINPTPSQLRESRLDLILAANREAVCMVEADGLGVTEDEVLEALDRGHRAIIPLLDAQIRLREKAGKEKRQFPLSTPNEELTREVSDFAGDRLRQALVNRDKQERETHLAELREQVTERFSSEDLDES